MAAVALAGTTNVARAQFTMGAVGQNASSPSVAIPFSPGHIEGHVINETEASLIRKELWRSKNAVDFRVSVTGAVTQFNKSWTTNNQNVVSGELSAYYYHTYALDKHTSIFKFDGIYGMNFIDDAWFKNQDLLKLYYLASWKVRDRGAMRNWAYSFSTTFASQFAEGVESRTNPRPWSNFMAPGTMNAGLGLTYTSPSAKLPFIVTINPISGDGLFVLDDRIDDERRKKLGILVPGEALADKHDYVSYRHKIEGGSSVNIAFNRTFAFGRRDGVTLQYNTTLNSFYGWMTQVARHETPAVTGGAATVAAAAIMPTVGWTNSLIFNPLSFLSMEFRTTTLYDRSQVDKVQMQYYVRIGLTYRYKNR